MIDESMEKKYLISSSSSDNDIDGVYEQISRHRISQHIRRDQEQNDQGIFTLYRNVIHKEFYFIISKSPGQNKLRREWSISQLCKDGKVISLYNGAAGRVGNIKPVTDSDLRITPESHPEFQEILARVKPESNHQDYTSTTPNSEVPQILDSPSTPLIYQERSEWLLARCGKLEGNITLLEQRNDELEKKLSLEIAQRLQLQERYDEFQQAILRTGNQQNESYWSLEMENHRLQDKMKQMQQVQQSQTHSQLFCITIIAVVSVLLLIIMIGFFRIKMKSKLKFEKIRIADKLTNLQIMANREPSLQSPKILPTHNLLTDEVDMIQIDSSIRDEEEEKAEEYISKDRNETDLNVSSFHEQNYIDGLSKSVQDQEALFSDVLHEMQTDEGCLKQQNKIDEHHDQTQIDIETTVFKEQLEQKEIVQS